MERSTHTFNQNSRHVIWKGPFMFPFKVQVHFRWNMAQHKMEQSRPDFQQSPGILEIQKVSSFKLTEFVLNLMKFDEICYKSDSMLKKIIL